MEEPEVVQIDLTNMAIDELDYFADTLGVELEEYAMKMDAQTMKVEGVPLRKFLRVMATIANRRRGIEDDAEAGKFGMMDAIDMMFTNKAMVDAAKDEQIVPPAVPLESVG